MCDFFQYEKKHTLNIQFYCIILILILIFREYFGQVETEFFTYFDELMKKNYK